MHSSSEGEAAPPIWLWRLVYGGLLAATLGIAALAAGLALGWANPPRAGALRWEQDFKSGGGGWTFMAPAGGSLAPGAGALLGEFNGTGSEQWAVALAPEEPAGDFTLEIAGATVGGSPAFGLIFGWQNPAEYSTLLINAHGYAEAYRQTGAGRVVWFGWQQWPHILLGSENNRLRVDVRDETMTLRVNDEIVTTVIGPGTRGRVGVAATASAAPGVASQVIFSWARLWAP